MLKATLHGSTLIALSALSLPQQSLATESLAFTYYDGEGHAAPYRLFLPPDHSPDAESALVLYMHGAGERGTDNARQLNQIESLIAATQSEQYASYLLAPQMNVGIPWSSDLGTSLTKGIVSEVLDDYPVDSTRIYATGFSAGGTGTLVQTYDSELYAAGVPIAAGLNGLTPELAAELAPGYRDMPLWVFHGALDTIIPVEKARLFVEAIRAAGGSPLYTEFPDRGHGIRVHVYDDENNELYPWLFSQTRLSHDLTADFNGDGEVDGDDFLTWQASFGIDAGGDADLDGDTDGDDFLVWQGEFGSGSGLASAAIPEPASAMLLLTFGFVASSRYRVKTWQRIHAYEDWNNE